MSDAGIAEFKTWGTATFASVQIVTVTSPLPTINCPPPSAVAGVAATAMAVDQLRNELRRLAPQWFVPATPVATAKRVA